MKKILLVLSVLMISVVLNASQIKNIGYVAPKYIDVKNVSLEVEDFFLDIYELVYDNYGDAMLSVINEKRLNSSRIKHSEIIYKNEVLMPDIAIKNVIADFYNNINLEFLAKVAKENNVSHIIFAKFNNSEIDTIIKKAQKRSKLGLKLFVYDAKENKILSKVIYCQVKDINSLIDYDLSAFQIKMEKAYLELFSKL